MQGPTSSRVVSLVAVLLLTLRATGQADTFCPRGTARAPVALKDIVKASFTAEIYSVDVKERKAVRAHEHYSARFGTSAIYISSADTYVNTQFQIYNRKTKVGVSTVGGGACRADNSEPTFGLMNWVLSQTQDVTYVGTDAIAGEPVHNWRLCYDDAAFDYREDLYTTQTAGQWQNPTGSDFVPVKIVVKKQNKVTSEISQVNHHFLRFEARDDDDPEFQGDLSPPIGSTCDISPAVQMPQLPESVIYTAEQTGDPDEAVTYILDKERQLVIMQGELGYSTDQYTKVDSYKLGVVFQMPGDAHDSSCLISPYAVFEDKELNKSISYTDSYSKDPFESVQHFVGISSGFTFNGEHTVRGIPCRVYTKFYEDYRGAGDTTVILYFTSTNIKHYSSIGGNSDSASVLIKKDVWKDGQVIYEHNIYNFGSLDYSRLDYDPLDISSCDAVSGVLDFILIFGAKDAGDTQKVLSFKEMELVKTGLKSQLAETAGVDGLRVHLVDSLLQGGKLMAQVRLQGPLAEDAYVRQVTGSIRDKSQVSADKYLTSQWYTSKKSCIRMAETYTGANFVSLCDWHKCGVYKDVFSSSELTIDDDCEGYFLGKNKVEPVSLDEAWNKITAAVESGTFEVEGYKASKAAKFDPSSVRNQTIPSIQKYEKFPNVKMYSGEKYPKATSLLSCMDSCSLSLGYECQIFTYCAATTTCEHGQGVGADFHSLSTADEKCDAYVRKYVSEFTALETTSVAIDKEMVFEKIDGPNDCAQLCLDLTDFRCESFDYCSLDSGGGSGTCSLFRKHYFDVAESPQAVVLPQTECTHYSRDYLGDYDRKDGLTSLAVRTKLRKSSAESCAKSCSSTDSRGDARCTMFHFCLADGLCEFVDESAFTGAASRRLPALQPSLGCTTHTLKQAAFQVHGRSSALRGSASRALRSKLGGGGGGAGGYGPGALAGLALVMLVAGAGLLLLALFVWTRYIRHGQGGHEMSMKFSKADL